MKKIFTLIFLLSTYLNIYAATLIITPSPNTAQCPIAQILYSVTVPSGSLPNCTYTWTINGGTIIGPNTGTQVTVKWTDSPGTGTLKVTAGSCSQSDISHNNSTTTNTYTRLSVSGQKFPTLSDFPPAQFPDSYSLPV